MNLLGIRPMEQALTTQHRAPMTMKMTVIAGTVLLSVIVALCAVPVSNRVEGVTKDEQKPAEQSLVTAQLIAELNSVETNFFVNGAPCTNIDKVTNRFTTGASSMRHVSRNLKLKLAEQGVTIRYVAGYYVDATTNAENGHALSQEDRHALAEMNFLQQTRGLGLKAAFGEGFVVDSETRMRILDYREQLEDRRISVSWDRTNEFYFVTSTQAPPTRPPSRRPWELRTSP
jgi:hypothetical protein